MGHVGSKTRSLVKSYENLVYAIEAAFFNGSFVKVGQNVWSR